MNDAAIGEFFSGSSTRTGARFRKEEWTGDVYVVRGRHYIKESDLLRWLEERKVEPATSSPAMAAKTVLRQISDRVLRDRKKAS